LIEEAKNTRVLQIEEEKQLETIVEDLTTPSAIIGFDEIVDWEDRMTRANYTSDQRDFIRQALVKKEEWLKFCASSDWKVTDDNKKDGITVSQCDSSHEIPSMKSSGIIDFSLMQVFATLHDSRYRT